MIESGNTAKAGLIIALQTQDLSSFSSILKSTKLELYKFVDPGGFNIFHDFAKTILKEYLMIPYLSLLLEEFKKRHPVSALVDMLNSRTAKEKQTPLHLAAKNNKIVKISQKLVIEYLNLGADPLLKDGNSQSVLHISAYQGFVGIFVYFYCNLSLNPNERDRNSYTPLHLAVMEGHENMSIFLISILKDINIKDFRGYTPLHLTVFTSSYKIAKHLIMNQASRDAKCNSGLTPVELALSRQCIDMVKVLV